MDFRREKKKEPFHFTVYRFFHFMTTSSLCTSGTSGSLFSYNIEKKEIKRGFLWNLTIFIKKREPGEPLAFPKWDTGCRNKKSGVVKFYRVSVEQKGTAGRNFEKGTVELYSL